VHHLRPLTNLGTRGGGGGDQTGTDTGDQCGKHDRGAQPLRAAALGTSRPCEWWLTATVLATNWRAQLPTSRHQSLGPLCRPSKHRPRPGGDTAATCPPGGHRRGMRPRATGNVWWRARERSRGTASGPWHSLRQPGVGTTEPAPKGTQLQPGGLPQTRSSGMPATPAMRMAAATAANPLQSRRGPQLARGPTDSSRL